MAKPGLQTSYFIEAMKSFGAESKLPITLAKVTKVIDEGYYVDVELTEKLINMQEYHYVPVLKNRYVNSPINKGDLVILMTFSHLLQNYLESKQYAKEIVWESGYFALPLCFKDEFKHKNEFSIRTLDEKFIITLNDEKLLLETQNGLKFEMSLTDIALELQKLEVKAREVSVKSQMPMELGTDIASLGAILNDICTALTLAGAPVTVGSATTTPNPGLATAVSNLQTKIGGSFS